ncbi:hypothetical protein RHODO2019_03315 [Rhodococcus antarcticus]|uniref:Immunity protein 53 of polymorphic toxin system n=1 Tax=Rhodococcus antarcticus TaxID=2987751 RepID=A0ABY6P1I3_9NOCA|nr:hypothetical protein [Rhodococcus antarcticus]UZJ25512.1 hypothetical protein RHODO2019_03315 [Rhodococcus antarcticus]
MDAEGVRGLVRALGVPDALVSVGEEVDGTWCLVPTPLDELGMATVEGEPWEVFWREHGDRFDWVRFTDERTACWYLLGRLAHSQLLRGSLTARAAPGEPEDPLRGGA